MIEPSRLDHDLAFLLNGISSERDRNIVAAHLGWNGAEPETLDAIGRRHGLTKERIRQIVERRTDEWRALRVQIPALACAESVVLEHVSGFVEVAEAALVDHDLSIGDFSVAAVRAALDVVGAPVTFMIRTKFGIDRLVPGPAFPGPMPVERRMADEIGTSRAQRSAFIRQHLSLPTLKILELAEGAGLSVNRDIIDYYKHRARKAGTLPRRVFASDFIRALPHELRPRDVVARGAERGIVFSPGLVALARSKTGMRGGRR